MAGDSDMLDQKLADFIGGGTAPTSIVEDPNFQSLVQALRPDVSIIRSLFTK